MTVFAGIDVGTSGVKVALVDDVGTVLATAARPCAVDIPHPGWSQQDPDLWWRLTTEILDELAARETGTMERLAAISLSGQMLGSVLLDSDDRPTTPCILWNDQRSLAECAELLARVPDIGRRTNGHPDPGLTAPKLLWLARHDPAALARAEVLMLPKDYVRLKLTGRRATEVTDASGTMLMDCATAAWDDVLLSAAGWSRDLLPPVLRSWEAAGELSADLCRRWRTPARVPVAAGAGDNYAGALGVGATRPGEAALSVGTSGVLSAVDGVFHPAPERAILTTPHAAPGVFLSMGVVMSATQSLDWLARLTGRAAADLAGAAAARVAEAGHLGRPVARPSFTGIRTPHNRPDAAGQFGGLTAGHDAADLAYAVLEGVAFQFRECRDAQLAAGVPVEVVQAVGGGTRSDFWVALIATLLDAEIAVPENGDISACLGAARLAHCAAAPGSVDEILGRTPPVLRRIAPVDAWRSALEDRFARFEEMPLSPPAPAGAG